MAANFLNCMQGPLIAWTAKVEWTAVGAGATVVAAGAAVCAWRLSMKLEAWRQKTAEEAQARCVTAWLDKTPPSIVVRNSANEPAYECQITFSTRNGQFRRICEDLAPNSTYDVAHGQMNDPKTIELAFRDAGGRYWRRDARGFLGRLTQPEYERAVEAAMKMPKEAWAGFLQQRRE